MKSACQKKVVLLSQFLIRTWLGVKMQVNKLCISCFAYSLFEKKKKKPLYTLDCLENSSFTHLGQWKISYFLENN